MEGNEDAVSPNESALLELSDDRVMINVRNLGTAKRRAISYSPGGISGWLALMLDEELQDPACFGSLARYDRSTDLFLQCGQC